MEDDGSTYCGAARAYSDLSTVPLRVRDLKQYYLITTSPFNKGRYSGPSTNQPAVAQAVEAVVVQTAEEVHEDDEVRKVTKQEPESVSVSENYDSREQAKCLTTLTGQARHVETDFPAGTSLAADPLSSPAPPSKLWTIWEKAVRAPVLSIRCKDKNAELHKSKLGSGNRGKCIKLGNDWLTPVEFEAEAGRKNSKDWKRSIKFGGQPLQALIDLGTLVPHAASCICSSCIEYENLAGAGPVRPFVHVQRKRKRAAQGTGNLKQTGPVDLESYSLPQKSKPLIVHEVKGGNVEQLSEGMAHVRDELVQIPQISLPSSTEDAWKVAQDAVESLVAAGTALRSMLQQMKARTDQEAECLRAQLQKAQQGQQPSTSSVQIPVPVQPNIIRVFDPINGVQTYSFELTPEPPMTECSNCARAGTLQCSGCRVVNYCSVFCQSKDWQAHRASCMSAQVSGLMGAGR